MLVGSERSVFRIKAIQATYRGANPKTAAAILIDGCDRLPANAFGPEGIIVIVLKAVRFTIEKVQAVRRAKPQISFFIDVKNVDPVAADARWICVIATKMDKLLRARVVAVQAAQTGWTA